MPSISLRDEYITLAQALKVANLADSGGAAKALVRDGSVKVNGAAELQPGRKLRVGDRLRVGEGEEWVMEGKTK